MDLTQIRHFLALAKTLNFTRAAEACNVTQPALTKSIQRLESELGGPLLLRERNYTQLTPLGATMLPLLQQTFDTAEAARSSALRFRHLDGARLTLGIGPLVEPAIVTPLVQQVAARFPSLELVIREGGLSSLNEWLLASEIDLTFVVEADRLTERANRWAVVANPIVVLMPPGHALASEPAPLPAEALVGEVLIGRCVAEADGLEAHYGVAAAVRHRGSTEDQVHALVRAGIGVALSTTRHLPPAGLVRRAVAPARTLDVFVAAIAGRPMSRAADAFLRLARARDWTVGAA